MKLNQRTRAVEAWTILGTFADDLEMVSIAKRLLGSVEAAAKKELSPKFHACYNRLIATQIVLVLAKWMEFYDSYKSVIPEDVRLSCRSLVREIKGRGTKEFRDKVVAHLKDRDLGRPLTSQETNTRFEQFLGENPDGFLTWVYDEEDQDAASDSVFAVTVRVRRRILEAHGLDQRPDATP